MIDPDLLLEMLSDPELQQALAEMSAYQDRQAGLGRQEGLGREMLGTPSAPGREVGRTYVASSPLEHFSVALQRGMGAKRLNDAQGQREALIQGDVGTRKTLAQRLADTFRNRTKPFVGDQPDGLGVMAPEEIP